MICFAGTEGFWPGALFGILAGWVGLWFVVMLIPGRWLDSKPPEHHCPYCGRILREITVACLDDDRLIPPEAQWICPNYQCKAYYFRDRPAAKPAGAEIEEI